MEIKIVPVDVTDPTQVAKLKEVEVVLFPRTSEQSTEEEWSYYLTVLKFFWAEVNGETAGSLHLGLHLDWADDDDVLVDAPGCLLSASLGVLPAFRGRGVASAVRRWVIGYAKSEGFGRIVTYCRPSNTAIVRINQKFGFELIGEFPDYWEDPVEPCLVMELKL